MLVRRSRVFVRSGWFLDVSNIDALALGDVQRFEEFDRVSRWLVVIAFMSCCSVAPSSSITMAPNSSQICVVVSRYSVALLNRVLFFVLAAKDQSFVICIDRKVPILSSSFNRFARAVKPANDRLVLIPSFPTSWWRRRARSSRAKCRSSCASLRSVRSRRKPVSIRLCFRFV